ncbi:MAG TPA: peptidoglycan editing factor PgeF [Polyangia bacterium]|nr:peptidoglycan editing factor PgeF [Polyangia bacterium]
MINRSFDGVPLLQSALIGPPFRHGFTTRAGGVSPPPQDSLNVGGKWGDAPENVAENRRRIARAAGAPLFVATQVHGADVARVHANDTPADVAGARVDALVTDRADVALAIFVADCIPALIADPRTGAIAAAHAGWRGTVAGVLPAAVRALAAHFGASPADLRVALGPAIGPCCFEVGPEVVAAFEDALPGARPAGVIVEGPPGGKPRVDLKRANAILLERAGVDPANVDAGPECTASDPTRFFSYRRDRGRTGQHLGVIARSA